MNYSIGVDIGGTSVAIAAVDETGRVVEETSIQTDTVISAEQMIKRISSGVQEVIQRATIQGNIMGIGVGSPGPLDSKNGIITCPPNLDSWRNVPIKAIMEDALSYPVILENDANAATLAEKWVGAGKHHDHVIYMTVSTGIGSGVIADGKLLRGKNGNSGDIGHAVIDPSFGQCTCGQAGCLEAIASGTAIARRGSELLKTTLSTEEVFELYRNNEPVIVEHIDYVLQMLGAGCVSLVNTFDTELIIIGGGVSKVGSLLFDAVQEYVRTYALNPDGRQTNVVPAKLGQSAGVIGAAALWFDVL